MTTGIVTFDAAAFKVRFPSFAAVDSLTLQEFFDTFAVLVVNNTPTGFIVDLNRRSIFLNYLVAHIAQLSGVLDPNGEGSTADRVGRVSSATEGTVTASLDMGNVSGNKAFFMQTQYGAMYWQLTAPYRTFRYRGPPRCC